MFNCLWFMWASADYHPPCVVLVLMIFRYRLLIGYENWNHSTRSLDWQRAFRGWVGIQSLLFFPFSWTDVILKCFTRRKITILSEIDLLKWEKMKKIQTLTILKIDLSTSICIEAFYYIENIFYLTKYVNRFC